MSDDGHTTREGFLSRWSRVKAEARETAAAPAETGSEQRTQLQEPAPELPEIDKLTLDSDFSAFLHPKVDDDVRRSALRKLFSDPHFNVMDGLDVYIDDYSKSEPIPAAMLASLKQAQRILDWASEKNEREGEASVLASTPDQANDAPQSALMLDAPTPSEPVARAERESDPVVRGKT